MDELSSLWRQTPHAYPHPRASAPIHSLQASATARLPAACVAQSSMAWPVSVRHLFLHHKVRKLKVTELERLVIERLVMAPGRELLGARLNFDAIVVVERTFTGIGFITELKRSEELQLFGSGVSFRWGRVGARLNGAKMETGYLIYIDAGYLTTIDGYTYGDEWPALIDESELYTLTQGTELGKP